MEYLSKSKILTALQCPFRYRLQYIERRDFTTNVKMQRGFDFHTRMEHLNNKDFKPAEDIDQFVYDIHTDLQSQGWETVMVEQELESPELKIRGIVDRVYKIPPGEYFGVVVPHEAYCVVEFKTGNPRIETLRFELSLYALLINNTTPLHIEYMMAYIPDRKEVYFSKIHTNTYKATLRKIEKVRKIIEEGKFPKVVDIHCYWCPFMSECLMEEIENDSKLLDSLHDFQGEVI